MAGTLEVTDELCWMPASWVFDTVLERLASELCAQDPELSAQILDARAEVTGGYLDLRDQDQKILSLLLKAADTAYSSIKQEQDKGSMALAFYEGLLNQFQEFRSMLHHSVKQS